MRCKGDNESLEGKDTGKDCCLLQDNFQAFANKNFGKQRNVSTEMAVNLSETWIALPLHCPTWSSAVDRTALNSLPTIYSLHTLTRFWCGQVQRGEKWPSIFAP